MPGPITIWLATRAYRRSQGEKLSFTAEWLAVAAIVTGLACLGLLCAVVTSEDRAGATHADCRRSR